AYLLAKFGGLHMVWWSFPIAEIMSFIVSTAFLIRIWRTVIKDIPEGHE
ncbi:MAG: MATE family efflux transporter, partial [Clostridium sp.]|nr:MATE family efflux transporter [Clostridium sp.]